MDFDTCTEFYEDFSSFVSPEGHADELEEILRSTDENLSCGLGYSFNFRSETSVQQFPSPSSLTTDHGNIKSECESPTDFNPDDFMNYFNDDDGGSSKSENRNTPSPTNSSNSSTSVDSTNQAMIVDTPPVSPQNNVIKIPANILPLTTSSTPINLLQGTLIPVQAVPLTTVQIQNINTPVKISPKPSIASPSSSKPKTIILSSKDFKTLIHKIQSNKGINNAMPKIIMKPTTIPVQPKSPPVLPKVLPTQTTASINAEAKVLNEHGIFKSIDEKHFKKQQRMIKNRESASLSRKKKKEYVTSLEIRINHLEKENTTLKGENTTLRSQLLAFAQTCQCNHNKLSEFLSNKFNSNIMGSKCSSSSSLKSRLMTTNGKKNTAVLLAMLFMVSLNIGSFQTYFSRSDGLQSPEENYDLGFHTGVGRRGLLWIDDNGKWNVTGPIELIETHGNESISSDNEDKCPVSINQTENLRLASELRKWIGVNDYLNLSSVHERPIGFKLTPEFFELKSVSLPLTSSVRSGTKRNRKHYFNRHMLRNRRLQEHPRNSLQIFKSQIDDEYLRLFEGIKRRDDTFYVLSFNSDHILLPAAAYNKSTRPRMSLMLPAGDPSINGDITLMQIDCEVLNTTEIQLKPEMIPINLRPKYNLTSPDSRDILNKTGGGPVQRSRRNGVENPFERKDKIEQFYRPYFMTPYADGKDTPTSSDNTQTVNSATIAAIRRQVRGYDDINFVEENKNILSGTHIHVH